MALDTVKPSTSSKTMTSAEMQEIIQQLMAEKQALADKLSKATTVRALSMKVSLKGAASLYGLGRFPVTLYQEQWRRLMSPANVKDITEWLDDPVNAKQLKAKGEDLDDATKEAIAERDAKYKAGK